VAFQADMDDMDTWEKAATHLVRLGDDWEGFE